jgi:hypothetical protein
MAVIIEIFLTPAEAMNEPADSFFLKQLLFLIIFGWFIISKSLGVLRHTTLFSSIISFSSFFVIQTLTTLCYKLTKCIMIPFSQ